MTLSGNGYSAHALPYSFGEARDQVRSASQAMKAAEDFTRKAYEEHAAAERAYRVALARKIVELHGEGAAWTVCQDLARGDRSVADLRYLRDVAEGVREAAQSATWRLTADRKDLGRLVEWSLRVAPDGQYEPAGVSA